MQNLRTHKDHAHGKIILADQSNVRTIQLELVMMFVTLILTDAEPME